MFATLLESRRTVSWPVRNGALSLTVHTAVTAFAVAVTASEPRPALDAGPAPAAIEHLQYVVTTEDAGAPGAAPAVRVRRRLAAPTAIPLTIPDVPAVDLAAFELDDVPGLDEDLARLVTRADDFLDPGDSRGFTRRLALPKIVHRTDGSPYYAAEVERMAVPLANNPRPKYPPILLGNSIEGDVIVQFVVDSTGSADPKSLRVMRSTHDLFTRAVKSVLPKMRFLPAEVAGTKVRVLVEQPFRFSMR